MKINPYEQIGIWHNNALDYIINNNQNPTLDEALNLISSYFFAFLGVPPPESIKYSIKETCAWGVNNNSDEIEVRRNRVQVTNNQLPYADQIYDNNTGLTVSQLNAYYLNIENNILNSDLEMYEQRSFLIATAVGKHSANYWTDVSNNPSHPWHSFTQLTDYVGYVFAGVTAAFDGSVLISTGRMDVQEYIAAFASTSCFSSL